MPSNQNFLLKKEMFELDNVSVSYSQGLGTLESPLLFNSKIKQSLFHNTFLAEFTGFVSTKSTPSEQKKMYTIKVIAMMQVSKSIPHAITTTMGVRMILQPIEKQKYS